MIMELHKNRDWLYQKYWGEKLPMVQIAKLCDCNTTTIRKWMKKFDIKYRTHGGWKNPTVSKRLKRLWRKKIYREKMSKMNAGENNSSWGGGKIKRKCKICNEIFFVRPGMRKKRGIYCSSKCWGIAHAEAVKGDNHPGWKGGGVERLCKICNEVFFIPPAWIKKGGGKTCSKSCAGKLHGKRTKGENNSRWLGGISFEPYGIEFNKQLKLFIRKRDGYRCQKCKIKEHLKAHASHHIDYNKKNNIPENLILLCASCHTKTGINRQYWQNHFTFSMQLRIND